MIAPKFEQLQKMTDDELRAAYDGMTPTLRQIARSTEQTRQWVSFWSSLSLSIGGLVLLLWMSRRVT